MRSRLAGLNAFNDANIRIAILDLNNGIKNRGIPLINRIVSNFVREVNLQHPQVTFFVGQFDVRGKGEVPQPIYDIYLSSGGPGSPYDGLDRRWEPEYFGMIDSLYTHNLMKDKKKFFFGICHSFQMLVRQFQVAVVVDREQRLFGIMPQYPSEAGKKWWIFKGLSDRFFAFENRDWQVLEPDQRRMNALGASITCYESRDALRGKAITGIRFSPEIIGVQFHPEAERNSILERFTAPAEKENLVDRIGLELYEKMIHSLENPNRVLKTYQTVIPGFLRGAYNQIAEVRGLPRVVKDLIRFRVERSLETALASS